MAVPSSLTGMTLREADLRRRYGMTVLGVKDHLTGDFTLNPAAEFRLTDDQLLVVIGKKEDLSRFGDMR
jgi:trk system potassium uptake protein TrkA